MWKLICLSFSFIVLAEGKGFPAPLPGLMPNGTVPNNYTKPGYGYPPAIMVPINHDDFPKGKMHFDPYESHIEHEEEMPNYPELSPCWPFQPITVDVDNNGEKKKEGIATLSSNYNVDYGASKCLDGISCTFCHTKNESNPYFMMEYPTLVTVTEVKVQARLDCCGDRVKNVVVSVTDWEQMTRVTEGKNISGTQLGSTFVGPARDGQWISFKSEFGLVGKYVVVQQLYKGVLNFAEVQVKHVDQCSLPFGVQGPCLAYFERWSYNQKNRKCQKFIYGGCFGNKNSFETFEKCSGACKSENRTAIKLPNTTLTSELPNETLNTKLPNETLITELPNATLITELPNATLITELPNATLILTSPEPIKQTRKIKKLAKRKKKNGKTTTTILHKEQPRKNRIVASPKPINQSEETLHPDPEWKN